MERKLKKPIPELRADLMADPRTKDMAERLGMTLEAYVEKVLDFAQHPEKVPQMNVLPEAEVKAQGGATVEEVKAWMEDVRDGKITLPGDNRPKDAFESAPPKKPGNF
jgi:hypothetical protein